jgi:endonuclease YncB( thermonuclease family)
VTTWTVPAVVKRVIDGDTVVADLDLGWGFWKHDARVRLFQVDCPELNTPEGVDAWHFTQRMLVLPTPVTIISKKLDSFGRVLGHIQLSSGQDLGAALVTAGFAKVQM